MKSSGNSSIGMLVFLALATIVFIFMILRPPVEKTAMNLGVPMTSGSTPAVATEALSTESSETEAEKSATAKSENSTTTKEDSESTLEENNQTTTEENTETSSEETSTEATTTN